MKILIADDHPLTLYGTKAYVESLGYLVTDLCSNGTTAFNLIQSREPGIAILDINMPGMDGLQIAELLHKGKSKCKIVLLTMLNDRGVYKKAIEYGIHGYILKNFATEELGACLELVSEGKKYVSPALDSELVTNKSSAGESDPLSQLTLSERKILKLICAQKSSKQIGEMLFISEKTVEGHRRHLIEKLGLPKEKNALLIWAMKQDVGSM